MKKFIKHNLIFILIYIILLVRVGYILLNNGKVQIHEKINSLVGNPFFDTFFKYITHLGDGIFAVSIAILTLFINVKKASYLLLSYTFASITSSILKNFIYVSTCRPAFCFNFYLHNYVHQPLKLVSGVEMNMFNSFPSGHSTTAFALFFSFLFMSENKFNKFIFLVLACLAAFSRTYLSQHWLVDIYFGSIIGFSFALFFYILFYSKVYSNKLNTTLINLIKK